MEKNALNLTAKMTIVFNRSKVNGELLLSCRKFFLIWIPLTLWNKLHPSHDGTTFTFQREEWWQRKETKAGMNKREKTIHTVSWWSSGTPDGIICTSRDLGTTPPVLLPTAQIEFLPIAFFGECHMLLDMLPQHPEPPSQLYTVISHGLLVGNLITPHLTWTQPLSRIME